MPIVRMTLPRGVDRLDIATVPVGERIGRCWILLFGLIPIDWDDLTLERLDPPNGFHERSSLASMRVWEHERWIEPVPGGGCVLRDRVSFEPRLAAARACPAAALPHRLPAPPPPAPGTVRGPPRIGVVIATSDYELVTEAAGLVDRSERAQGRAARRRADRLPPGPGHQRRGGARPRRAAATPRCSTTRASCAPTCGSCAARTGSALDTRGRSAHAVLLPHGQDLHPRPRRQLRGRDRRRARSSRWSGPARARRARRGAARPRSTPSSRASTALYVRTDLGVDVIGADLDASARGARRAARLRGGGRVPADRERPAAPRATTWTATRSPRRRASTSAR